MVRRSGIPRLDENPSAKFKESPIEDTSEKLKILSIRFTTALTALLTVNKSIFLTTDEFAAVIPGDGPQLCGCRDVVVSNVQHRDDPFFRICDESPIYRSSLASSLYYLGHRILFFHWRSVDILYRPRSNPPIQLSGPFELNLHHPISTVPHTKPVTMATRRHNAKASLLDDKIDILNRNTVEVSSSEQVFRTTSAILALVRVSALALLTSMNSKR